MSCMHSYLVLNNGKSFRNSKTTERNCMLPKMISCMCLASSHICHYSYVFASFTFDPIFSCCGQDSLTSSGAAAMAIPAGDSGRSAAYFCCEVPPASAPFSAAGWIEESCWSLLVLALRFLPLLVLQWSLLVLALRFLPQQLCCVVLCCIVLCCVVWCCVVLC